MVVAFFFLGGRGGGRREKVERRSSCRGKDDRRFTCPSLCAFFLTRSLSLPLLPIRARRHRLRLECACRAREKVGAWAHRELACSLEEKASRKLFFRRPPQARSRCSLVPSRPSLVLARSPASVPKQPPFLDLLTQSKTQDTHVQSLRTTPSSRSQRGPLLLLFSSLW